MTKIGRRFKNRWLSNYLRGNTFSREDSANLTDGTEKLYNIFAQIVSTSIKLQKCALSVCDFDSKFDNKLSRMVLFERFYMSKENLIEIMSYGKRQA